MEFCGKKVSSDVTISSGVQLTPVVDQDMSMGLLICNMRLGNSEQFLGRCQVVEIGRRRK